MATAVAVDAVRKTYGRGADATVALAGVDLAVESGRFVSLIGPSGCGKSTLLRVVAGLEAADAGSVAVHGLSPASASAAKLIGFVPQTPALLPWRTVLGNVELPRRLNPRAAQRRARVPGLAATRGPAPDAAALLARAGLGDALHKLPAQLSGGMQQRAAIVRAFALQPDLLLMDEPFSALDELTRESLQDQLLDLWDDLAPTVVFVTHSVTEAVRLSDAVVVMAPHPGRVVDVVEIDLPRPRDARLLADPRFHQHEDLLRERLHRAWQSASAA